MKQLTIILFLFSSLLCSCNSQEQQEEDIQIFEDPYTVKVNGNEIHIYFSSDKAYIPPGYEDEIIEPVKFDYQNKTEFIEWYRKFHNWQNFTPRYNYWVTKNELDTINTYFYHVKGKFADIDYMLSWAYETSKSLIILFCNLSGCINPFNCSDEYETFRWE